MTAFEFFVFPPLVQDRLAFAIQEALELADACGVTHFAEGFGLDLADSFAGDFELFADFLKRAAVSIGEAEAELEHLALALGQ